MIVTQMLAILIAYVIDSIIGDPKSWPHPVKAFGKLIALLDARLNRNRKIDGAIMLVIVIIIVGLVTVMLLIFAYEINFYLGLLLESVMIATTMAQKALKDAALDVYHPLIEKDLPQARQALAYIVGRDTAHLDEAKISRATIETVAENTSDGVTAPLFWALIGGGPLAMIYRAINTCDSMVGYKNEKYLQFGWASAKLDDIVNWLPARITGFLMVLSQKPAYPLKLNRLNLLSHGAKQHASPNSAWTEAAVAILLGIQLGGINYYHGIKSVTPLIGEKHREIKAQDILSTIKMMYISVALTIIVFGIGVGIYVLAKTWG